MYPKLSKPLSAVLLRFLIKCRTSADTTLLNFFLTL